MHDGGHDAQGSAKPPNPLVAAAAGGRPVWIEHQGTEAHPGADGAASRRAQERQREEAKKRNGVLVKSAAFAKGAWTIEDEADFVTVAVEVTGDVALFLSVEA